MRAIKVIVLISLLIQNYSLLAFEENPLHLQLISEAESIFQQKEDALNLYQIKEMVAGDSIDLKVAYENLYQAQRQISVARAAYFPYGVGDIAQMYFYNVLQPLILVELITSLPSKWYNVQKEKNMRMAKSYSLKSLKENIRTEIAIMYYGVLKEEAMLKFAQLELILLEKKLELVKERVLLGLADENDVRNAEIMILELRDEVLKFESYLLLEKEAFNILLSKTPYEGEKIKIQPNDKYLDEQDLQLEIPSMIQAAISRSHEISAANYMVRAAASGRQSAKWSILSFRGLGFGYWGRVEVAASQVGEAKLHRQLVEKKIENAVYTSESRLRNSISNFSHSRKIVGVTQDFVLSLVQRFQSGDLPLEDLIKAERLFLTDYREFVDSHYSALKALESLNRITLGTVESSDLGTKDINVLVRSSGSWTEVTVKSEVGAIKIKSVTYNFNHNRMHDMTSYNQGSKFRITLKGYGGQRIEGVATIVLGNGEITKKRFLL